MSSSQVNNEPNVMEQSDQNDSKPDASNSTVPPPNYQALQKIQTIKNYL